LWLYKYVCIIKLSSRESILLFFFSIKSHEIEDILSITNVVDFFHKFVHFVYSRS
jgi:hypothetical protein